MPLRITADGESWTTEDYTLDEMVATEKRTGTPGMRWAYIAASAATDRESLRALIVVWFARPDGVTVEDAEKRAGALTGRQLQVQDVEDDRPVEHRDGIPVVDPKADGVVPATT